jgi:membrane protease YdiL (CAAX protease family)
MKHLYSARNALEAHNLRKFLAAHGIDAKVTGDTNAFDTDLSATPPSAPGVFVDEADFDRASALLAQFENQPALSDSPAPPVDEEAEDLSIESEPYDVSYPTIPGSNRSAWSLWLEVFAVLALTKPLYDGHSLASLILGSMGLRNTAANLYLPSLLHDAFAVAITLTAMHLSGDPWSAFGIKKPAALDILTGSIVCIIGYFATMMGVSIFVDILKSVCSERYIYQLTHTHDIPFHVHGWNGLVLLFVLAFVVGFSEELVMRSYLIPRLERLLHSTWASVLVGATVFGLLHWKSGILNVCHAFIAGIVYGIAFVWTRRLWPVAIAHAMYDFSAFLSDAG